MARVYLETSFFSACVSKRVNPKSIVWRETSLHWWERHAFRHELFISSEVIIELSDPKFRQREAAARLIDGLHELMVGNIVTGFAQILVRELVMPGPSNSGDAIHAAAATVHEMDYILSWNVRHLANPRKRDHFCAICAKFGYIPPQIITPDSLMESDDEQL